MLSLLVLSNLFQRQGKSDSKSDSFTPKEVRNVELNLSAVG